MRKQSAIMNESGFYLPYVMVVAVITLSIISTSIFIYKNEVQSTRFLLEQIQNETLIQMARAKFKQEAVHNIAGTGNVTYTFPNGTVLVNYEREKENQYFLHLIVETNKEFRYNNQSRIHVPEEY